MQLSNTVLLDGRTSSRVMQVMLPLFFLCISSGLSVLLFNYIQSARFIFFIAAVVLSTWFGGAMSGLLCAIVALPIADYLLFEPRYSFTFQAENIIQFSLFILISIVIAALEAKRQNTQNQMNDTTLRLYSIIDSLTDSLSVRDEKGQIVIANKKLALDMGYPDVPSMLNDSNTARESRFTMYDAQGAPLFYDQLPHKIVFKENRSAETSFRARNNQTKEDRWYTLRSSPVRDQQGQPRFAVTVIQDMTALRDAQDLQDESDQQIRDLMDNVRALIFLLTPDGKILEINDAALHMGGGHRADVVGTAVADYYWWNYSAEAKELIVWLIERARAGASVRLDMKIRIANGNFMDIDFTIAPIFDKKGDVQYLVSSAIDITDRKKKENELRHLNEQLTKQQARMNLIFENVPGLIWEMYRETDTKTTEIVSDYAETLLGYPPRAWRDTQNFWRTIIYPDDLESATAKTAAIVESGKPGGYEFRCIHRDGHLVPIEAHISLLKNEQSTPVGICGVFMDLTERKQYEAQLSANTEALRRSNAELETFAYLASHDLQEPLRMISSYLQLLVQRYGDRLDGDAKEFIDYAVDGAARMKMLINDLLTYSRIQRAEVIFQEVNLEKVVQRSLNNLQLTIADTHAIITHDPMPQKIKGNETQLLQVFQNLLENALKFKRVEPPQIHLGVREEEHQWVFSVTDNGIGIDNRFLERIFVIFQRLHSKAKYPGTGIGLAICKRVIENHQGKIWAESVVGVGTTFYFTLPC